MHAKYSDDSTGSVIGMGIEQFERRLERLVEGTFAKAFRGQLQPIEIGKRLKREMDLHRTVTVRGLIAPNIFEVNLARDDFERLGSLIDVLASELVDGAQEHAHSSRYSFIGPVEVSIGVDRSLSNSTFNIKASVLDSEEEVFGALILSDGKRVGIGQEPLLIGRSSDCQIQIDDTHSSRHHAEIQVQANVVWISDLSSRNGTKVNAVTVNQHHLIDGDVISIGATQLRFEAH